MPAIEGERLFVQGDNAMHGHGVAPRREYHVVLPGSEGEDISVCICQSAEALGSVVKTLIGADLRAIKRLTILVVQL